MVFLLPVAAGVFGARLAADLLPPPAGTMSTITWWMAVLAAATVSLVVVERLARRLLPLAWLLRMSLLFPTRAPRRWKLARQAGSVHGLEARLADARAHGKDDDETAAAQTILTLVTALQAHDRRTRGHAERVRVYTDMLTEELGLTTADRDRIRWAALLHDIGKLAISAKLLNKAGQLDDEEWTSLRRHPEEGARFCGPLLTWLGPWGDTIVQHHEKFGGGGYPAGLAGEEIGLGARIVAVPDAYEVMTSPRAYKRAMSSRAARQELADCAGAQFDPAIVRAFLNLSIRRLQWVAGPAAWLAQLPFVNAPGKVNPSTASVGMGLAAIVALGLSTGIVTPMGPAGVAAADTAADQGEDGGGAGGGGGGAEGDSGGAAGAPSSVASSSSDIVVLADGPDAGLAPDDLLGPDGDLAPDPGVDPGLAPDAGDGPGTPGAGDDGDDPIVVILPPPDAGPDGPDGPGGPGDGDPDAPAEPEEPVVVIIPTPAPTEPAPEPTSTPGPVIVIIPPPDPPAPSPSPTPSLSPVPTPSPTPSPDPTVAPTPSADPTIAPSPDPTIAPSPSPDPTIVPSPSPDPSPPPAPDDDDGKKVKAHNDHVTVALGATVTVSVLANDEGPLDSASLAIIEAPDHGTAVVVAGTVVYTAPVEHLGNDHLVYRVCGTDGRCDTAHIHLEIPKPEESKAVLPLPLLLGGTAAVSAAFRRRRR